jgi:hypothetical protein
MHLVVEMGHGLSEGLDAGSRAILTAVDVELKVGGTGETTLDVILYLYCRCVRTFPSRYCGLFVSYLRGTLWLDVSLNIARE